MSSQFSVDLLTFYLFYVSLRIWGHSQTGVKPPYYRFSVGRRVLAVVGRQVGNLHSDMNDVLTRISRRHLFLIIQPLVRVDWFSNRIKHFFVSIEFLSLTTDFIYLICIYWNTDFNSTLFCMRKIRIQPTGSNPGQLRWKCLAATLICFNSWVVSHLTLNIGTLCPTPRVWAIVGTILLLDQ